MNGAVGPEERRIDEAIAWHASLGSDDADWDGFTRWLEADPRNRAAFDEIALLDRVIDERAPALVEGAEPLPERRRGTRVAARWLGGAVAAAIVAGLSVTTFVGGAPDTVFATATGEQRTLALGHGIAIELAPSSKLVVSGRDASTLELAGGEAFFTVQHDPARMLAVTAGGVTVTDIGTRFAVSTAPSGTRIGVAAGRVSVATDGGPATPLGAGDEFVADSGGTARVTHVAAATIGSWRRGQLSYTSVPIGIVATDIQRYVGQRIEVDQALSSRRFSGVLVVGDGSKLVADLAGLMGVAVQADGNRIRLVASATR